MAAPHTAAECGISVTAVNNALDDHGSTALAKGVDVVICCPVPHMVRTVTLFRSSSSLDQSTKKSHMLPQRKPREELHKRCSHRIPPLEPMWMQCPHTLPTDLQPRPPRDRRGEGKGNIKPRKNKQHLFILEAALQSFTK